MTQPSLATTKARSQKPQQVVDLLMYKAISWLSLTSTARLQAKQTRKMFAMRSASTLMGSAKNCGAFANKFQQPLFRQPSSVGNYLFTNFDNDDKKQEFKEQRRCMSSPAYRRYLSKQQQSAAAAIAGPGLANHQKVVIKGGPGIHASQPGIQVPTLEVSKALPHGFSEMDNEPLLAIAEMGNHSARIEVLKRHIMAVDHVNYQTATITFHKIAARARQGMVRQCLPYQIGIAGALLGAFGAIPMVFDVNTAMWFNETYVTMDIPPPSDLDTSLGM